MNFLALGHKRLPQSRSSWLATLCLWIKRLEQYEESIISSGFFPWVVFLRTVKTSCPLTRPLILPIIGNRTRTGSQKTITTPADCPKKDSMNKSDPLLSPGTPIKSLEGILKIFIFYIWKSTFHMIPMCLLVFFPINTNSNNNNSNNNNKNNKKGTVTNLFIEIIKSMICQMVSFSHVVNDIAFIES